MPFSSLAMLAAISRDNGGVERGRMHRMIGLMARYLLSEPLLWAERAFVVPRVAAHEMPDDPIFVLGYWRSGTTYLQQVLSHDPRMVTPSLFDSLFADVCTVARPWLKPTLNGLARAFKISHSVHRVPMNLDLPGETDVALCAKLSPHSHNWGHLFPRNFQRWISRCALDLDPEAAKIWLEEVDQVARKCSWAAGGRRVILKSPGDTARVALLLKRYPRARFVYIHRDPVAVFHSNRYLWGVVLREFSLQGVTEDEADAFILWSYRALLESYLAQRDQVPSAQLVELRYEDLMENSKSELTRVYAQLDLGSVPDVLWERLAVADPYRKSIYETSPELEAHLRETWAFAFEQWPKQVGARLSGIRQMEEE